MWAARRGRGSGEGATDLYRLSTSAHSARHRGWPPWAVGDQGRSRLRGDPNLAWVARRGNVFTQTIQGPGPRQGFPPPRASPSTTSTHAPAHPSASMVRRWPACAGGWWWGGVGVGSGVGRGGMGWVGGGGVGWGGLVGCGGVCWGGMSCQRLRGMVSRVCGDLPTFSPDGGKGVR